MIVRFILWFALVVIVLTGSMGEADETLEKAKTSITIREPLAIINKSLTAVEPSRTLQEGEAYYLIGSLDKVRGTVLTDAGEQETTFQGEIGFKVITDGKGTKTFVLERLNLVSAGVNTKKGNTGVLGVTLIDGSRTSYDPATGKLVASGRMTLHYELIDKVMGFIKEQSEECALFNSYTEKMTVKLELQLPREFMMADNSQIEVNGAIRMDLDESVLGSVKRMQVLVSYYKFWWYISKPTEILKIQPVYIGTGPSDASATGSAFNTLINGAVSIWDRCGTVRCITLRANPPIYINNNAYKVLTSYDVNPSEANALMAEVNVVDAVEVFVVDRWDPLFDGGGATWSSGTASAKIITCDQQMNVPCPPPCGGGTCGPVNTYHLAHELGHSLNLGHPSSPGSLSAATRGSVMEPSGFCADNPNVQSARNCRSASNPLLYSGRARCEKSPDIMD